MLAVVLRDRRPVVSGELRYCDLAVGVLEKAVSQDFGAANAAQYNAATGQWIGAKTIKERDDAVSRAMAWLKSQGLAN